MYRILFIILLGLILMSCNVCQEKQDFKFIDLPEISWKQYKFISIKYVYIGEITFEGNEINGPFTERYPLKANRIGGYNYIDNYIVLNYDDEQDHVEGFVTELVFCDCFLVNDRIFIKKL